MPPEQEFNKAIKTFSATKRGFYIFLILAVLVGMFLVGKYFRNTPIADCTKCEEEKKVLVDVMLDIRKQMKPLIGDTTHSAFDIHFNSGAALLFPFVDTVPKKRVAAKVQVVQLKNQQQQVAVKVTHEIDSIIRKLQQHQQQKPKN
jgi:hypothetical protein